MTFAREREAEEWNRLCLAEAMRWGVLLKMHALRGLGSDRARRRRLPPSVDPNLFLGDALMFRPKSWKSVALAFDAYAWALAYLAYSPGGVTFLGMHVCTGSHGNCPHGDVPPRAARVSRAWWEPLAELEELAGVRSGR